MNDLIHQNDKEYLMQKLETIYVPFYVKLFEKLPFHRNICYIGIGFVPLIGLWVLSKIADISLDFTTIWIFSVISAIFTVAYAFLGDAYNSTCDSLDETIRILTKKDQFIKFEYYLQLMFKSRYQIITCFLLAMLGMIMLLLMDLSLDYPLKIYLYFIAIFAFLSAGPGLWLALSSAYFISQLKKIGNLKLNTICPSETLGIKKLSKLLSMFSIYFSIELLLFLLIFFLAPWNDSEIHNFFARIIILPLILFMLFFFIYPQMGLKTLIVEYKEMILMDIESQIKKFYIKDIKNIEDLELIKGFNDIYNEINRSANYAIDLNIIFRFASSLAFPLIFMLKQSPEFIIFIINKIGF